MSRWAYSLPNVWITAERSVNPGPTVPSATSPSRAGGKERGHLGGTVVWCGEVRGAVVMHDVMRCGEAW